jgi:hypothetical protein
MKESNKRIEVSLDTHCTDEIPCDHSMHVKLTGLIIFLILVFIVI